MIDPIVEDVRRIRDAMAARFGYDVDAIFQHIKEQERRMGYVFVAGAARRPELPVQEGGVIESAAVSEPSPS